MEAQTLGRLLTVCFFGGVGWFLARWLTVPAPVRTWVLLVLAVIVGGFVGLNTKLVSVFGVAIQLNWAIASCSVGILVGLLIRTRELGRLSKSAP